MKRIFGVLAVATLVLTGCPSDNNKMNINLDGGSKDMPAGNDLTASNKKAIGEACTKNADCAGNLCFVETMGIFKGGYCTKACSLTGTDTCGDGFECGFDLTTQSTSAGKCYAQCDAPDACRDGYQCWVDGFLSGGPVCFPAVTDVFDSGTCDPTKVVSGCAAGEACQRIAHNDGTAGTNGLCMSTCFLGVGTCGDKDQCVVRANSTVPTADYSATYTGDKGIFTQCLGFTLGSDSVANGGTCDATGSDNNPHPFAYACVDGSQCALPAASRYYSDDYAPGVTGGDSKCYTLCYKDGSIPTVNPDAGVEGTVFAKCPGSTTCQDSFGLFNNTDGFAKVGLCK